MVKHKGIIRHRQLSPSPKHGTDRNVTRQMLSSAPSAHQVGSEGARARPHRFSQISSPTRCRRPGKCRLQRTTKATTNRDFKDCAFNHHLNNLLKNPWRGQISTRKAWRFDLSNDVERGRNDYTIQSKPGTMLTSRGGTGHEARRLLTCSSFAKSIYR